MRRLFLPLFFLFFTFSSMAQITIERSDYLLEIGDTTFFWNANKPDEISLPTGGENQVWDYRDVDYKTSFPHFFRHTPGTDANFPEANILVSSNLVGFIPGLALPVNFVSVLDENGHQTLGRIDGSADVSLESMTGNSADSLNFPGTVSIYENPSIDAYFPMNYNDSQVRNQTVFNNFFITITAFGLDHVPGNANFINTSNYNIIGWGSLQIPNIDNGGMMELEVLLREETSIKVDTFLLGGAPAPTALLDAFGLIQGKITETKEYTFWAKGLSSSVMTIIVNGDGSQIVRINRDIPTTISSTRKIAAKLQALHVFPNPASTDFYLEFEQTDSQILTLSLLNTFGQLVYQETIRPGNGIIRQQISLPDGGNGIYQLVLRNEEGQLIGRKKIVRIN